MPYKTSHSLVQNFYVAAHIFPDVELAALFHPDSFEVFAVFKRIFTNFPDCAGKRDFFDFTVVEALSSNVLHAARDLNAFEIFAKTERIFLDSLQLRGKCDVLYLAIKKGKFSKFLQAFVQPRAL